MVEACLWKNHKGNICSNFSMYKELPEDGYMW